MHIDGPMPPHFVPASGGHPGCAALQDAARQLEASFLEEMLRHAGLGELGGEFSGGTGEAQFSSFLRHEQVTALCNAGGIGISDQLFEYLARGADCGE